MYPNPDTFNPGYNAPAIRIDLGTFFNPAILNWKNLRWKIIKINKNLKK